MVPDPALEATTFIPSRETQTKCVLSCPVPSTLSTRPVAGFRVPKAFDPSAVNQRVPCVKHEPVRTAQRSYIDRRQRLLPHQVHHGKGMQSAFAIVRHIGCLSIGPDRHLMRVLADRNSCEYLKCHSIDDRQRMRLLGDHQQSPLLRALRLECFLRAQLPASISASIVLATNVGCRYPRDFRQDWWNQPASSAFL